MPFKLREEMQIAQHLIRLLQLMFYVYRNNNLYCEIYMQNFEALRFEQQLEFITYPK